MTEQPPLLPLFFKMTGRKCLVVGAGFIGQQKTEGLLECGADVTVVAPEVAAGLLELEQQERILLRRRAYVASDLHGFGIVIAATSDSALNHEIYRSAVALGMFCNVVDDPEYCDFYFGSIVRRGSLEIAISTAGESPAFAQRLKEEIAEALPPDVADWLAERGELRREVNRSLPPTPQRITLLRELARRESCNPETCPCRSLGASAR